MILFDLRCSNNHAFEAWFRDSKSYDRLNEAGEVRCSICGDHKVEKALMAPNVRTKKAPEPTQPHARDERDPQSERQRPVSPAGAIPPATSTTTAMEPLRENGAFKEKVAEAMKMLREAQTVIEKNFDHVGRNFAEEARKIHYGEAEKRNIYGEATTEEAASLNEEGIEVNQIPWLPNRNS